MECETEEEAAGLEGHGKCNVHVSRQGVRSQGDQAPVSEHHRNPHPRSKMNSYLRSQNSIALDLAFYACPIHIQNGPVTFNKAKTDFSSCYNADFCSCYCKALSLLGTQ